MHGAAYGRPMRSPIYGYPKDFCCFSAVMMMMIQEVMFARSLQLETVTSVLVIRPGKQFSFQITTGRGYQMTAAYRCWKRGPGGRSCHGEAARTVSKRPCAWNSKITTCYRALMTTTSVISDRLAHGRQIAGCQVVHTVKHQHRQLKVHTLSDR